MQPNNVHCPKCNSTQLSFNKKGFSGKKAVVGAVLTGGIGLLAGTIGSNKMMATCFSCGNIFAPFKPASNSTFTHQPQTVTLKKSDHFVSMICFIILTLIFLIPAISMSVSDGFTFWVFCFLLVSIYFASSSITYWRLSQSKGKE